jgi:hypothetical protein
MVGRRWWWRRWFRQVVPRRRPRDCCTYHRADWHAASSAAIQLVHAAWARGITEVDAVAVFVEDAADAEGLDEETCLAVSSLVGPGLAIQPGGGRPIRYYEGRHRTIAMMDAGVRRTVVICEPPDRRPLWRRLGAG